MPSRGAVGSPKLEQEASSSQADTEPLSFDDEEGEAEEKDGGDDTFPSAKANMQDENSEAAAAAAVTVAARDAAEADAAAALLAAGGSSTDADAEGDLEEDADADADGDLDPDVQAIVDSDGEDTTGQLGDSTVGATAAGFSDESDLTDESSDEDAEGEADDDDEMGGDDDDDDEDEDEGDDEDADGEDDDDDIGDDEEGENEAEDEDEAAKGLAALTTGKGDAADHLDPAAAASPDTASGLDGLAVLAAAGASGAGVQLQDDSDTDSTASTRRGGIKIRRGRSKGKPSLGSRLNEVMVASQTTSDQGDEDADFGDEDEEEGQTGEGNEEGEDLDGEGQDKTGDDLGVEAEAQTKTHSREMSSLGPLASAAKRTAARSGPAAGLLAGAPAITVEEAGSGPASVSSSREGTPKLDEDQEADADEATQEQAEEDAEKVESEKEKGLETPLHEMEEAAAEEEPSTDEAAVKRQEAMESLTKIEIGFAVLRDKLYVERMDEINKEGEMILDGTHPDLIYLTNFIEARRERRLNLVEMWFEQQQKQYERVAKSEEAAAWSNWKNEVVQLRNQQLDDVSRKRRKLDREKRTLDGPRPARRHQIFETELVRNPDYDAAQAKTLGGKAKKHNDARQQELEDLDEMGAYVAYPDLRGADEGESWVDMDRMGIQMDPRLVPGMAYYRMEDAPMESYGMYPPDGLGGAPPPGSEMMPAFGGAPPPPPPQEMVVERTFDRRGAPSQGYGGDAYGPMVPNHGPPRARGPPEGLYPEDMAGGPPPAAAPSGRKRAVSPAARGRSSKTGAGRGDDRDRPQGRRSEGQGLQRQMAPPGSYAGPPGPGQNRARGPPSTAGPYGGPGATMPGQGGGGPPPMGHPKHGMPLSETMGGGGFPQSHWADPNFSR